MSRSFVPRSPVLYPEHYLWYILASCLDILVTYVIVYRLGGAEVNLIANNLLALFGHWGLIGLKFATVILVVGVCEIVGRLRPTLGRGIAIAAIVISAMPVGIGLLQVFAWTHLFDGTP
jgi:uncharacterized membrane protein